MTMSILIVTVVKTIELHEHSAALLANTTELLHPLVRSSRGSAVERCGKVTMESVRFHSVLCLDMYIRVHADMMTVDNNTHT